MAYLEDIIFNELATEDIEDVSLAEGAFTMSPVLAYYTLKRNALKKLKSVGEPISKAKARNLKGKALQGREKLRADLDFEGGKNKDATVYKLTKQQKEALSQIYEKHGPEMVKEIMKFRKDVLAPYQVIKRTVKNNKMLTSKETLGMTKEQFNSAVESGRRKIEARGNRFEKFEELKEKSDKQERSIQDLEQVRAGIKTNKRIPPTILERILKEYDLGQKEFNDYSMNDLKKAYFEITKNVEKLGEIDADDDGDTLDKAKDINKIVQQNVDYRKGRIAKAAARKRMEVKKAEAGYDDEDRDDKLGESYLYEYKIDLTKNKNFRLSNGGFNSALGLYFLRRQIMDQLKPDKPNSAYRETYVKIVDKLISDAKDRKKTISAKMIKNKSNTEFNERERKIWELRPSVKTETGEVKDYIQKLKVEDFFNPKHFKKSNKLIKAEKDIEAGIKRFERSLKKTVTPEEFATLKKYRLINNLVTVGELSNPDKLFKSPDELKSETPTKKEFVSDSDFERKIREIATSEYDSLADLNAAKKEARELFAAKEEQGDDDIVGEFKGLLTQINNRKNIKAKKVVGDELAMADDELIDAGVIETAIKKMLNKDYSKDNDALKRDNIRINKMVKKYKDEEGEEAERNMEEIDFLFKKLKAKTQTQDYKEV